MCAFQAWVFLCSFLADFVVVVTAVVLAVNFVIFYTFYKRNNLSSALDPVLAALFSLIFPVVSLKSVCCQEKGQNMPPQLRRLVLWVTVASSTILLSFVAITYYMVHHAAMGHDKNIIIRRDVISGFVAGTITMGILSIMFILAAQRRMALSVTKLPQWAVHSINVALAIMCCLPVILVSSAELYQPREEIYARFSIATVCKVPVAPPIDYHGYSRNSREDALTREQDFYFCNERRDEIKSGKQAFT